MSDVGQINALSQVIRRIDGNHTMGAGALAEAILEHRAEWDTPRIIRTVEELKALDPDTVLCIDREFATFQYADCTVSEELPAVVIRDGAEVRAARETLDKETNND